jgi:hypothetical protein
LPGRRWGGYRCAAIAGDSVLDFGDIMELRKRFSREPAGGRVRWGVRSPVVSRRFRV